jgi:hypothetical protein
VRSLRIRYRKSKWLRFLVDSFGFMGDRGYRGCEYVEVCESKEQKGIRQAVEGVNSQIKVFNRVSKWRKVITLLAYLYGYAIGYSFFRKSHHRSYTIPSLSQTIITKNAIIHLFKSYFLPVMLTIKVSLFLTSKLYQKTALSFVSLPCLGSLHQE